MAHRDRTRRAEQMLDSLRSHVLTARTGDPLLWCRRLARALEWLTGQDQVRGRRVEYSVGFAITEKLRDAIDLVPKTAWTPGSRLTAAA